MRVVSLLPSATEIVFALGRGDDLVGVTFECDFPAEARQRRIVTTSALPQGLSPAEIDAAVTERIAAGEDLYRLDRDALADLRPDVVLTQDLCAVCAVDVSEVDDALAFLGCTAEVVTLDPHTLDEVLASVLTVGNVLGADAIPAAQRVVDGLRSRLATANDRLPASADVWAVDADAFFVRPGPRVVDGAQLVGQILHPDLCGPPDAARAARA